MVDHPLRGREGAHLPGHHHPTIQQSGCLPKHPLTDQRPRVIQSDLDAIDASIGLLETSFSVEPEALNETHENDSLMSFHADFERFSVDELGIRSDALRRSRELVRLFNLSGGRRDRKRLKGKDAQGLFELRHRTSTVGGLRVFYRRAGAGWIALAAMSKYDDRQQQEAIERVARHFASISP